VPLPDQPPFVRPHTLARILGVTSACVRQWIARGQLPVAARDARARALLAPTARPTLGGAREVTSHAHGGLLATAGGPGKLRRVSLKERKQHRGAASCGCEVCSILHASEETDRRAARERVFEEWLEGDGNDKPRSTRSRAQGLAHAVRGLAPGSRQRLFSEG
jgi:hypothetical protein